MSIRDDVLTTLPALPLGEIMPMICDGDVLLCSAHDAGSRLIGWTTRSQWTHVAMAYWWPSLRRVMAFESVHTIGVRAVSIAKFIQRTSSGVTPYPGQIILARHSDFKSKVGKDPGALQRLGDFAVDRFGDPFASKEILKIAGRILLGRSRRPMPPILAPDDEFICSEYVAKCFERVGIAIAWDGAGFIAPGDIALDAKIEAVAQFAIAGHASASPA
jgi:hypothetical protein